MGGSIALVRARGGDLEDRGDPQHPPCSGTRPRRLPWHRTHLGDSCGFRALGVRCALVQHRAGGYGHQALGCEVVQASHCSRHARGARLRASAVRARPAAGWRVPRSVRPAARSRTSRRPVRPACCPAAAAAGAEPAPLDAPLTLWRLRGWRGPAPVRGHPWIALPRGLRHSQQPEKLSCLRFLSAAGEPGNFNARKSRIATSGQPAGLAPPRPWSLASWVSSRVLETFFFL